MDEPELRRRLADYKFYHVIPLTETLSTPGEPGLQRSQAPVLAAIERMELAGQRVLDIGCPDGLYALAAAAAERNESSAANGEKPVIDRALILSRYVAGKRGGVVDRYWHGSHGIHTRFGGDREQVRASGVLSE